jgi:acetyltransferase-like isoleucine patch superfamily enzyme
LALKSLNQFLGQRNAIVRLRNSWLRFRYGIELHSSVAASLSSRVISGRRGLIVVGPDTLIAFKTLIYSRDRRTGEDKPVRIGSRCFIGGGSMILPGVTIGDECIVGAGAVVFEDVPARSIVGGNPARILRSDIEVGRFGRLKGADETALRQRAAFEP